MNKWLNEQMKQWIGVVVVLLALTCLWLGSRSATAVAQDAQTDHAAAQLVAERCGICHSTDLVTQQRLDRSRWTATVDKMIHWGAPLSPEERNALVNYLAVNYHPNKPVGIKEGVRSR